VAKIKRRRLRWKASASPQVVGYKLYWSSSGGVDYNSNFVKLGNVTEIVLPDDVKDFAHVEGPIELGIAAIDEVGNESDMVTLKTPFQFAVPQAPSDLWLETLKSGSADPEATPKEAEATDPETAEGLCNIEQDLAGLYQKRTVLPRLDELRRQHAAAKNQVESRSDRVPQNLSPFLNQDR
jgi:hypothetical protein